MKFECQFSHRFQNLFGVGNDSVIRYVNHRFRSRISAQMSVMGAGEAQPAALWQRARAYG